MELNNDGLRCPMPIARLGQMLLQAKVGDLLTITATDPPFPSDIRAWCRMTGHTLLSLDESDPRHFVAVIRKEER